MEQNISKNLLLFITVQVFDFAIFSIDISIRSREYNISGFSYCICYPVFCGNSYTDVQKRGSIVR